MTSGRSTHGSDVRVQRVDLAELRAHLADLHQQAARQRREGDEAFLDLHAFGRRTRGRNPRARTDRRPPGTTPPLRCMLERPVRGLTLVLARGAEEVADHGDVRVEDLRQRTGVAVDRQRSLRASGAFRAGGHRDSGPRPLALRPAGGCSLAGPSQGWRSPLWRPQALRRRSAPRAPRVSSRRPSANGLELLPQAIQLLSKLLRVALWHGRRRWLRGRLAQRWRWNTETTQRRDTTHTDISEEIPLGHKPSYPGTPAIWTHPSRGRSKNVTSGWDVRGREERARGSGWCLDPSDCARASARNRLSDATGIAVSSRIPTPRFIDLTEWQMAQCS